MNRTEIIVLKSDLMYMVKDLDGLWNGNDFQRIRAGKLAELIDSYAISNSAPLELEGRTFKEEYTRVCGKLNEDPYDLAVFNRDLSKKASSNNITSSEVTALLKFCNILKDCLDYVLKGA